MKNALDFCSSDPSLGASLAQPALISFGRGLFGTGSRNTANWLIARVRIGIELQLVSIQDRRSFLVDFGNGIRVEPGGLIVGKGVSRRTQIP